jgi:predicted metal-dependent enzyme (double-stranded beta helix superfamily)
VAQLRRINPTGDVSSFVPPGDIHYVCNPGPETAISLHVYGADLGRAGSSIRRTYDLAAVAA